MSEFALGDVPLIAPHYQPSGLMPIKTMDEYRVLYQQSIENLGQYWAKVAHELEWMEPWQVDMEGSLPDFRFFSGGTTNVSVNCIDRHARANGAKTALIWRSETGERREWTYQQLLSETARFATSLKAMGVGKGDVVAIFLPNLLETFAAVHACYRIGAIYNIVFSGFSPEALFDRLIDTQPRVVVTADGTFRRGRVVPLKAALDKVIDRLPSIEHVVVIRRTGQDVTMRAPRDIYWHEAFNDNTPLADPVPVEANEPGFIIYTSGTTSRPKGLVHSGVGFLVGTYHNVRYSLDIRPEDVYWCTADTGWLTFPIFELVGGLAHGVTAIVYEGAMDYPNPSTFYQIMAEHRVTKIFTAPTWLRMLARYGPDLPAAYDLSPLELIGLVGEPLDPATWQWVQRHVGAGQVDINNTYGQSETGSAWVSSVAGVTPLKPGSCGCALPGHSYAIVDAKGQPVATNGTGILTITAPFPALARTIWHDPERFTTQYFSQFPGQYTTFDSAVQDRDEQLWILGRVDDVINVAAHRLSTMEMESAILDLDGVAESAVIGVDDAVKGQVPVAFITTRQATITADEWTHRVTEQIAENIGAIAKPAQVFVVDAMPKTRSGKIVRRLLKEILLSGEVKGDITGLENPEVIDALCATIRPEGR
ncbi:acetate--CoA ligase [Sulfobacillus sp. hq2]|uniref:acetate--CoA ligase n=1 Tax=Sulfobacillus TaxID=28033 RepID=UPI000CD2FA14|nr:acetate--CoA ligase [Sulfobacillus sp. hq2]POB09125.1 acetyl-coenzyme A synthetase [Sulfobacillus sp. hq2]